MRAKPRLSRVPDPPVGIRNHRFVHPLHAPGRTDLSADVDFGAIRSVVARSGGGADPGGVKTSGVNSGGVKNASSTETCTIGTSDDGVEAPRDKNLAADPAGDVKLPTTSPSSGPVELICPPLAEQRHFLAAMGIEPRVNALMQAAPDSAARRAILEGASRLVEAPGMGSAYKALAIAHPRLGRDIPGFARCTG
jgi:hypothetical protein